MNPFTPGYGSGLVVSASTTNATRTIVMNASSVRVTNSGAVPVFFKIGLSSSTVATSKDLYLLAGTSIVVSKSVTHDTIAAITASSTSTLQVISGEGGI